MAAGIVNSYDGEPGEIYFVHTDADGDAITQKTFGEGEAFDIAVTNDGGYVLAAHSVLRLNANAWRLWEVEGDGLVYRVRVTPENDIIGAGRMGVSPSRTDYYLTKISSDGTPLWERAYGGDNHDECRNIVVASDGSILLLGNTRSFGAWARSGELFVVKTDPDGDLLWQRVFGSTEPDYAYTAMETTDGGFVLGGYTYLEGRSQLVPALWKIDNNGNELWRRTYDVPRTHILAMDRVPGGGGYTLVGWRVILGTDVDGEFLWKLDGFEGRARSVFHMPDGGIAIAGSASLEGLGRGYLAMLRADPSAGPVRFRRGDSNAGGVLDVADAVFTLSYLFASGPSPTCLDAADANDDGTVDIADAIAVLSHLFASTGPLPEPFGKCGVNPTIDADGTDLGCESFPPCQGP